jgi:hypothetical protein
MRYLVAILAMLTTSIAIADNDPFIGTWSMNVSASKYAANQLPKAMRIVMELAPEGVHYRSETTHVNDRTTVAEYVADYDGKLAMVVGSAGVMAPITLKRIDANTVDASYVKGMQVVATSRRELSKDGRIMTITTVTYDDRRHATTNVGVYERVN